ncbi:F0F1 ATP synthase subunit epsilon [Lacunimicrobium album]
MIAANHLQLVVITPERKVIDQQAFSLQFPLEDGQIGILPSRAPMVGRLSYGEMVVTDGTGKHRYFIDGGFCQVKDSVVTILTGAVTLVTDLKIEKIRTQIATVQARPATTGSEMDLKNQELRKLAAQRSLLERRF